MVEYFFSNKVVDLQACNFIKKGLQQKYFHVSITKFLTLFKMGEAKRPPTSFSPVTSTNVGVNLQDFLTFSFNPFATLVSNFKAIPSASPKLLNLNQDHLLKKWFLWSIPYKIEVLTTFLIKMLELPNFGHMITSTI